MPLSCVLPSDRGQRGLAETEALARLREERAQQRREAAELRGELAKVRNELAAKERAEQERRRLDLERELAEKERKLAEDLQKERARVDARFAAILSKLEDLGGQFRNELDKRYKVLLLQVQRDRTLNQNALRKLFEERLGRMEKAVQKNKTELRLEPSKKEIDALASLLSRERKAAAKDRLSLRTDLGIFMKAMQDALASAKKERRKLASQIPSPAPKIDLEALVDTVVKKLRREVQEGVKTEVKKEVKSEVISEVKAEVRRDLKASLEATLEPLLKAQLVPALKPFHERLLRVEALGEKRAKDLDLKVTALGRAVDSLVRAVRALRVQAKAQAAKGPDPKGSQPSVSKPSVSKPKASKSRSPNLKSPNSKPSQKGSAGKKSPAPIRRRKAGIPAFGEGDGFFERPEYWIPSLAGLLLIFVLLGRRPRTGGDSPQLVGGRYLPRPSEGTQRSQRRPAMEPQATETPSLTPQPPKGSASTPSPLHLSLRISPEELAPGGEQAVRSFLASEAMVLVRPEPRVDRRADGSLSIRFYIPGSVPPHLRRELRERCESLAVESISSPSN